jgi:hypothetical protein
MESNKPEIEIITDKLRLAAHAAGDIPKLLEKFYEKKGDYELRKKYLVQVYQRISSVIIATRQELDSIAPEDSAMLRLLVARSATDSD